MMPQRLIYSTKDLRNAIAHNDVIFDCRFKSGKIDKQVGNAIANATGVTGINFETITDYLILVIYQLKLFQVTKTEMKQMISRFETIVEQLRSNVPTSISDQFASYFLMPPVALSEAIKKVQGSSTENLGIKEIVKLEQYFGVSRQAILYRLIEDNKLTSQQADQFRHGVIRSAVNLGFDDSLYKPLPENKRYKTYGYYIQQAEEVLEKNLVSTGKYEQLLLTAFRPDLVYGDESEGGELID